MIQMKLRVVGTSIILLGLFSATLICQPLEAASAISLDFMTKAPLADTSVAISTNANNKAIENTNTSNSYSNRSEVANEKARNPTTNTQGKVLALSAAKQKLCVNRKNTIENKVNAMSSAVETHYERVGKVFQRVESYQQSEQIDVDQMQYDLALSGVREAETSARAKIDALKQQLPSSLDCTSDETVQTLKTIKSAAAEARLALKNYSLAVRQYIAVLQDAYVQEQTSTIKTQGTQS